MGQGQGTGSASGLIHRCFPLVSNAVYLAKTGLEQICRSKDPAAALALSVLEASKLHRTKAAGRVAPPRHKGAAIIRAEESK